MDFVSRALAYHIVIAEYERVVILNHIVNDRRSRSDHSKIRVGIPGWEIGAEVLVHPIPWHESNVISQVDVVELGVELVIHADDHELLVSAGGEQWSDPVLDEDHEAQVGYGDHGLTVGQLVSLQRTVKVSLQFAVGFFQKLTQFRVEVDFLLSVEYPFRELYSSLGAFVKVWMRRDL